MVGLDNTIVNVGLPEIGKSLHTSVAGLQWTVAGYTIVLASLLLFSGAAADRIGRRTIFQVGLSLFTLGSWLCSLAPSLSWLIAFRVLQGIGGSMLNPAALGIITNVFSAPRDRAKAIGVWDGVSGLSMALGPVAGGILVGSVGWRGIFWANIPVGLAAISLTALLVPDSKADQGPQGRPARPGPGDRDARLAGLRDHPGAGRPAGSRRDIIGFFLLSLIALGLLLRYEPRRAEPLIDFRFFKSVPFSAANATAVCAIAASAGFLFLTTLYLQDVRGFSALRAGLTLLPMPCMMALASPISGRIVARGGPRVPFVIAGAALTLSTAALSQLSPTSGPLFLIATYGLFGFGAGMVNVPISNGVMAGVPKVPGGRGVRDELLKPPARPVARRRHRRLGPRRQPARLHARRLPHRRPRRLVDHGRLRLRGPGPRRHLHHPVGPRHRRQGRRGIRGTITARTCEPRPPCDTAARAPDHRERGRSGHDGASFGSAGRLSRRSRSAPPQQPPPPPAGGGAAGRSGRRGRPWSAA